MTGAATIVSAIEQARADLDALRDRVEDLSAERQAVASAPCDRETAEERVNALIRSAAAAASRAFDRPGLFSATAQPLGPFFAPTLAADLWLVLARLVPDAVRDAFLEHHTGEGLSDDARTAKVADLDRHLLAAEIAEELACREIEGATGSMIPRRLEADPAILLAPDAELEPPDDEPAESGETRRKS